MKRLFAILLGMLLIFAAPMAAQQKKGRAEMWKEMQEFKIKFLSQEMELKDNQIKQFSDVYMKMSEEKGALFRETRKLERKLKSNKEATDEDYAAMSKQLTEVKERDAAIDKKYDALFADFLTSKQIFKMKAAEEKFREKMHQMRHKKRAK